jgi:uncharacterized membrane protein
MPTLQAEAPIDRRLEAWRTLLRAVLATAFLAAGIGHLVAPDGFLAITPGWVPFPRETILLTGIAEIAGALALLFSTRLRPWAGGALALYAVCVFPANIKHAVEGIAIGGQALGWGYHAPRLLFQPVIVWWALFAGGLVDWPFRRRGPGL